jgi:hypothetical protein
VAITTFAELQTAGDNWITRSDMADRWPECIALAEGVANRLLDVRHMYARNAAFAVDSVTETLPTGFGGVRAFYLNVTPPEPLVFVKADDFGDPREAGYPTAGRPTRYTMIGETFVFSPSPDSAYTATLVYRQKLTALSVSNTTNWLLTAYPDVYLHGMLAFGYQFIEDTEMEGKFMSNFLTGLAQINADDSRQSYGSAPSRRVRGFN